MPLYHTSAAAFYFILLVGCSMAENEYPAYKIGFAQCTGGDS